MIIRIITIFSNWLGHLTLDDVTNIDNASLLKVDFFTSIPFFNCA